MPAKLKRTQAVYPASSYRNPKNRAKIYRGLSKNSYANVCKAVFSDINIPNAGTVTRGFAFNSLGFYVNDTLFPWGGASEIAALYDAYRITKVIMEFTYNNNSSLTSTTNTTLPWIFTAPDYDDAGGLAGVNVTRDAIQQKDGVQLTNFGLNGGMMVRRTIVPKLAIAAYGSAGLSAYMEPKAKQWVSTGTLGTADAKHYGMWMVVDDTEQVTASGNNGFLRVFARCYFEMKHAQ